MFNKMKIIPLMTFFLISACNIRPECKINMPSNFKFEYTNSTGTYCILHTPKKRVVYSNDSVLSYIVGIDGYFSNWDDSSGGKTLFFSKERALQFKDTCEAKYELDKFLKENPAFINCCLDK